MRAQGKAATVGKGQKSKGGENPPLVLADLGIDKDEAKELRLLASLPDDRLGQIFEEQKPLGIGAIAEAPASRVEWPRTFLGDRLWMLATPAAVAVQHGHASAFKEVTLEIPANLWQPLRRKARRLIGGRLI